MSIEGVDFSFARPDPAGLYAAGKRFVVRYVTGATGKALTKDEIAAYHANGLAIALVFESVASRPLSGHDAGAVDAGKAAKAASALGFPSGTPIYFAVDFNANAAQYPTIDAYLAGAASVIGRDLTGVYGHVGLVDHCWSAKTAAWFWQTYAWSNGKVSAHAHLFQYRNGQTVAGGKVDLCLALQADYGQWPATNPPAPSSDTGDPMLDFLVTQPGGPSGTVTVKGDGHSFIHIGDGKHFSIPAGTVKHPAHPIKLVAPLDTAPGDRQTGYLFGDPPSFLLASDVTFAPDVADCSAVQHTLDLANSRIHQAVTALGGTI